MIRFVKTLHRRAAQHDYWLAGQFTRKPYPLSDRAMAAWSEQLGQASAALWMDACRSEGRGR
mgnify:CR=1 FL=1